MKKKIINGLLIAVALVTATSSFVSCKDYEGDNYAELQQKYATLQEALTAQVRAMQDYLLITQAQQQYVSFDEAGWTKSELAQMTIKARLAQLGIDCNGYTDDQINALRNELKPWVTGELSTLEDNMKTWTTNQLANYYTQNEINNLLATNLLNANNYTDTKVGEAMQAATDALNAYKNEWNALWKDDLEKAIAQAAVVEANSAHWNEAYNIVSQYYEGWNETKETVDENSADWNRIVELVDDKSESWDEAYALVQKILEGYDREKGWTLPSGETTEDRPVTIQDIIDYFASANNDFSAEIQDLIDKTDKIIKVLQTEITGIEIQAAVNPIYGSFSYPVGVQSNVLATYYGEFANASKFPVGDDVLDEAVWASGAPAVLTEELNAINAPIEEYAAGTIAMDTKDGNAGQLYLTINPSTVDFSGASFTLRNSQNKVSKVTLSELKDASDTELKWGYFRAPGNGFYVANATIAPADAKDVDFHVDYKSIQSEFDNIMTDWTKTSAADIAKLGLSVVNAVKADVPRLGVQAQWQDAVSGDWKNYVSKYDLAAVSITPLSYDFLAEADYSAPIEKVRDQITGKLKALDKEITNQIKALINVNIGLPATAGAIRTTADNKVYLDINTSVNIPIVNFSTTDPAATITIKEGQFYPGLNIDGSMKNLVTGEKAIPESDIDLKVAKINGSTDSGSSSSVNASLDITSLFNAIKDGIEGSIGGVSGITGTVDKYINRIINAENKIFNKVASVAKNPNRFIQPALIAQSADFGYFYPSRIYFAPTQVKKGTKISFYPTTLTGEVVAPAFKKYVAILNDKKFNPSDTPLNTVFAGNEYNLQKPFEYTVDAPAGTVLEFIYECLDYTGKVAGKKYYIEVYE